MATVFGRKMTRRDFEKVSGNMEQFCGLRRSVLNSGSGAGMEIIELRTGGGLCATITPGRTLDILDVSLNGCPFGWITPLGPSHPAYSDFRDEEYLHGK